MALLKFLIPLLAVTVLNQPAVGDEGYDHAHAEHAARGLVHFPISCEPPAVQDAFDRAVTLLHSFEYERARDSFQTIAKQAPTCAMAWWGMAMTHFHQHWDQPTPEQLASGSAAAKQARELDAGSDREKAYIAAIGSFYHDTDKRDHRSRLLAYKAAMEKLTTDYPEDHEASVFYALALLSARSPDDTSYTEQRKAGEILNRLLPQHPEHPGIVHYLIHAFDYPELAERALPAARIYAEIAPDAPHGLHMPAHIFTRLGLWKESIASNLDSSRVADALVAQMHPGAASMQTLHNNDYLTYAYLQLGDDQKAEEIVAEAAKVELIDSANFAAAYALVSIPARYALERGDWQAAAQLKPPTVDFPWQNFPYAKGNIHYAVGIGAARSGDLKRAREERDALEKIRNQLAAAPPRGPYDWVGRFDAMRLAVAGWIAHGEDRSEEAVTLLTRAAELEEAVGKHSVAPGPLLPGREMLGDLLLELERPAQALAAYEATLAHSPKRLNALAGAARAAELAGDHEHARAYYKELLSLCRPPVCQRPLARQASTFLNTR